jgi:hypothetical protein
MKNVEFGIHDINGKDDVYTAKNKNGDLILLRDHKYVSTVIADQQIASDARPQLIFWSNQPLHHDAPKTATLADLKPQLKSRPDVLWKLENMNIDDTGMTFVFTMKVLSSNFTSSQRFGFQLFDDADDSYIYWGPFVVRSKLPKNHDSKRERPKAWELKVKSSKRLCVPPPVPVLSSMPSTPQPSSVLIQLPTSQPTPPIASPNISQDDLDELIANGDALLQPPSGIPLDANLYQDFCKSLEKLPSKVEEQKRQLPHLNPDHPKPYLDLRCGQELQKLQMRKMHQHLLVGLGQTLNRLQLIQHELTLGAGGCNMGDSIKKLAANFTLLSPEQQASAVKSLTGLSSDEQQLFCCLLTKILPS